MQHKLSVAEGDLDKLEGKLHEHKAVREEHESNATNSESLQRKVDLLESELDTAEKNLRETTEKYVTHFQSSACILMDSSTDTFFPINTVTVCTLQAAPGRRQGGAL